MTKQQSTPLDVYMRHIAHVNDMTLTAVIDNILKQTDHDK